MKKLIWFVPTVLVVFLSFFTQRAEQNLAQAFCPITLHNPLGCSPLGENLLTQIAAGLGETSFVALTGQLASLLLASFSLMVVFLGKKWGMYTFHQRLAEAFLTIPSLLLALAFQTALGGSSWSMIAAIAVSHWPLNYKWLQSRLSHYERETFIEAAICQGARPLLLLQLHLVPHLWHDAIFLFFAFLPASFLTVSALEFLGFSVSSERDGLGYLVAANKDYIFTHPHLALSPAVVLVLLILYFTTLRNKFFKVLS